MTFDPFARFRLDGRTAVITGGASGIGEACAVTLAAAGARVVVADLDDDGAADTVRQIEDNGGTAIAHHADITDAAQMTELAERAVAEFGSLDVMANVAGIAHDGRIIDVSADDYRRVFDINVLGTINGCQAALRVMTQQETGGSIVNVASASIDVAAPKYGLYAASKAAVAQLTMTLAVENGRFGVRVNTIAPGSTITPFTSRHAYDTDGTLNQEKYDEFVRYMEMISPLKRVGEAQDQADLVLYLASDASKFATGQVWRANGGQAIVR